MRSKRAVDGTATRTHAPLPHRGLERGRIFVPFCPAITSDMPVRTSQKPSSMGGAVPTRALQHQPNDSPSDAVKVTMNVIANSVRGGILRPSPIGT
jgi:hypothetical protein